MRSFRIAYESKPLNDLPSIIFHENDVHIFGCGLMHHVKGEKVNSLDGGDVFPGHVGKVISGVLNRDFVGDYGVLHRLQRRRPNSCNESQETQHSFTNYNHLNIF